MTSACEWARLDSNTPANRHFLLIVGAPVGAPCEHEWAPSPRARIGEHLGTPDDLLADAPELVRASLE